MFTRAEFPQASGDEQWHRVRVRERAAEPRMWHGFVLADDESTAKALVDTAADGDPPLDLRGVQYAKVETALPGDDIRDRLRDVASPDEALYRIDDGQIEHVDRQQSDDEAGGDAND